MASRSVVTGRRPLSRVGDELKAKFPGLSLILLPILIKAPLLFGMLVADSTGIWGGVSIGDRRGPIWGDPSIDPNIGYTSHALGSLSARMVRDGIAPWWNPYEGVGAPLAAGMQSAALFPPTWLLLLPNGQVVEHLLFQIVAGLATYAVLRRLGAGRLGAWLGGVAFAFNGVFAWLGNAAANPVCLLPVVILGVEKLSSRRFSDRCAGGVLVALGVAASLYAGFPETAYLNGLLIGAWTLMRAGSLGRAAAPRFVAHAALFAACGILLAAPLLLPFGDYLRSAHVGAHEGGGFAWDSLDARFALHTFLPYYSGTIFTRHPEFWGRVGGYAGLSLAALATVGALGEDRRGLRRMLAAWIVFALGVSYGFRPLVELMHLAPFTEAGALYRYLPSSWLFAASVLAGLAADDLRRGRAGPRRSFLALSIMAGVMVACAALSVEGKVQPGGKVALAACLIQCSAFAAVAVALGVRGTWPPRVRAAIASAACAIELIVLFAIPVASHPSATAPELGGIAFLQKNLGFQRFVSLGPIEANYGSYFGIAQLDHNDLPVPKDWVAYAKRHLDPAADPIVLRPSSAAALVARLPAYAAAGTRFVVAPAARPVPGLTERYADRLMRIYEVPGTQSYFHANGCAVQASSRTVAEIDCARPARLDRLELWMPGWTASVNGRDAPVTARSEIFQAVDLPAGRSRVEFRYAPPMLPLAYLLCAAGFIGLLVQLALTRPPSYPDSVTPGRRSPEAATI